MYVDINTEVVNTTFIRIMRYGEFFKHCWSWLVPLIMQKNWDTGLSASNYQF